MNFDLKFWRFHKNSYLCIVFFIVLDLRLIKKVGVQRNPIFFAPNRNIPLVIYNI